MGALFGNFSLTLNPPNREDESVMKTDLEDHHDDQDHHDHQDHPDHHGDHDDLDGKEEEDESDGDIVPNPDTVEYEVDNTWEAEVEPTNNIKTNYLLFIGQQPRDSRDRGLVQNRGSPTSSSSSSSEVINPYRPPA